MPVLENAKHEAFARAIVEGSSGRDAYRGAGYKPKSAAVADAAASRLLRDVKVAARVSELKQLAAARSEVKAADVLAELAKIAFSNMGDYVALGVADPKVCLAKLSPAQAAAISSLTFEQTVVGSRIKRFALHDKRAALVDLGNHLGLFKQRHEHTGKDGKPIETKDASELSLNEIGRRIAFALLAGAAEAPGGK
jgi:phage terminase small subunit